MIFEIEINGVWTKVRYDIFRSWSGRRRIDGELYEGPVVQLGEGVEAGGIGPREVEELIEWEMEVAA